MAWRAYGIGLCGEKDIIILMQELRMFVGSCLATMVFIGNLLATVRYVVHGHKVGQ